jgi:Arc/MetJ-type ribon-helix-helix transcriptional regulator
VIQFDRELESFVQKEVESGHFASREALLSHAVELLRRDREEAVAGILLGLEDADADRMQPLREAIADIRRGPQE